ncbi:PREDICTED: proteasome subunit beta type-10 isoform X1 [Rhinopithecus bieti]|uniref:proteasome subunit beta type-10 isoform X1 n=1 Tax=Rhinopithecus bieti TaxID=61621 RepID=UPI00083C08CD|nr:PREDICTED: proteasome subunit beta type-10 isoform X1 [Rhinopithecus bieti]
MLKPALEPRGGFSFENCQRNASLERVLPGLKVPHARKTGTTIAGLVFQDGVILGADTRATNDSVVADKSCEKIHFIAPKIYCCGAGVAADAEMTTRMVASKMELHALSTGREPRVATVTRVLCQTLFRYRGHVGASLIVGGVDLTGPQLYGVHPHGSYSRLPFTALGEHFCPFSSNPARDLGLTVVLQTGWQRLTSDGSPAFRLWPGRGPGGARRPVPAEHDEAAQGLLVEAITAGILGDLGSGGNVDACVITKTGAKLLRTLSSPTEPVKRSGRYHFVPGTTAVLTQTVKPLTLELVEETVQAMEVE